MKTVSSLALLAVAVLMLNGCAQDQTIMAPGESTVNPPIAPTPPARPNPTDPPNPQPRLEPLGGSESSTVTMMLPASEKGGTVYLEKSAPKEVLVGKEFDYKIRLTNMSRSTLEGVT
ncbi:MAG: hypothetical protein HQ546_03780, partial [Planctomycetes bacterium]|nr:hypothetical protein [Planctomycetota bacterium]